MGKLIRIMNEQLRLLESYEIFTNTAGDDFWGDIGGGVLAISKSSGRILMALRSAYVNEPNTWGVVGGALDDPNEDMMETVKREFEEETGYRKQLKLFPAYVFKTPTGSFEYHNFIGLVNEEFVPKKDWETELFQWMSFDEMMKLKPKHHFGLTGLLKDSKSLNIIKKLHQKYR